MLHLFDCPTCALQSRKVNGQRHPHLVNIQVCSSLRVVLQAKQDAVCHGSISVCNLIVCSNECVPCKAAGHECSALASTGLWASRVSLHQLAMDSHRSLPLATMQNIRMTLPVTKSSLCYYPTCPFMSCLLFREQAIAVIINCRGYLAKCTAKCKPPIPLWCALLVAD